MQVLALRLDNYSLALQPAARQDDEVVWVPADVFACTVAAECKEVDGQWAICVSCLPRRKYRFYTRCALRVSTLAPRRWICDGVWRRGFVGFARAARR